MVMFRDRPSDAPSSSSVGLWIGIIRLEVESSMQGGTLIDLPLMSAPGRLQPFATGSKRPVLPVTKGRNRPEAA